MKKTLMTAAVAVLMLACGGMPEEGTAADADAVSVATASTHDEGTTEAPLKEKTTSTTTSSPSKKKKTTTTTVSTFATHTTDAREAGVEPTWKSSFVIADTWSVQIASELPATITGHHVLDVYVYSPDGSTYQAFSVKFAAGTAASADEIEAEQTATGFRIWAELPVIGSFIDNYGLVGNWKAQTWLDGVGPRSSADFQLQ